jgi:hypothetical protein
MGRFLSGAHPRGAVYADPGQGWEENPFPSRHSGESGAICPNNQVSVSTKVPTRALLRFTLRPSRSRGHRKVPGFLAGPIRSPFCQMGLFAPLLIRSVRGAMADVASRLVAALAISLTPSIVAEATPLYGLLATANQFGTVNAEDRTAVSPQGGWRKGCPNARTLRLTELTVYLERRLQRSVTPWQPVFS